MICRAAFGPIQVDPNASLTAGLKPWTTFPADVTNPRDEDTLTRFSALQARNVLLESFVLEDRYEVVGVHKGQLTLNPAGDG